MLNLGGGGGEGKPLFNFAAFSAANAEAKAGGAAPSNVPAPAANDDTPAAAAGGLGGKPLLGGSLFGGALGGAAKSNSETSSLTLDKESRPANLDAPKEKKRLPPKSTPLFSEPVDVEGPQWEIHVVQYPIGTRSPAEDLRLIPRFRNSEDGFTVTSVASYSPPDNAGVVPGSRLLLTDGELATHEKLAVCRRLIFAVPGPAVQRARNIAMREKQMEKGFSIPGVSVSGKTALSADRAGRDGTLLNIHRTHTELRETGVRLGCLAEKEIRKDRIISGPLGQGFAHKFPSWGGKAPSEKTKDELLLTAAETDGARTGRLPEHKLPMGEKLTPFLKGIRLERVVAIIKGMNMPPDGRGFTTITCVSELADRDEDFTETFAEDLEKAGLRKLEVIRLLRALDQYRETNECWKEWSALNKVRKPEPPPFPGISSMGFGGAFSPPAREDDAGEAFPPKPAFGGGGLLQGFGGGLKLGGFGASS